MDSDDGRWGCPPGRWAMSLGSDEAPPGRVRAVSSSYRPTSFLPLYSLIVRDHFPG